MLPSQELLEQAQFLKKNKWVRHTPYGPGEACLVFRMGLDGEQKSLSRSSRNFVIKAILTDASHRQSLATDSVVDWNDCTPGLKKRQVVKVLHTAAKLAEQANV